MSYKKGDFVFIKGTTSGPARAARIKQVHAGNQLRRPTYTVSTVEGDFPLMGADLLEPYVAGGPHEKEAGELLQHHLSTGWTPDEEPQEPVGQQLRGESTGQAAAELNRIMKGLGMETNEGPPPAYEPQVIGDQARQRASATINDMLKAIGGD